MTNESLWRLFPIVLSEHDPAWAARFREEAEEVTRMLGECRIVAITHIGSIAVPDLIAKPTIDILPEIARDTDIQWLKEIFSANGYLRNDLPKNRRHTCCFEGRYTPHGYVGQCFHVHFRYPGDWDERLFSRIWLRALKLPPYMER